MTDHQAIALAHPCYLAGETVHERFGWREGPRSFVLTVNSGYE